LCESTIAVRSISTPLALGSTRKQRQPIALAGGARAARRHDQKARGVAIDHKGLVAHQA